MEHTPITLWSVHSWTAVHSEMSIDIESRHVIVTHCHEITKIESSGCGCENTCIIFYAVGHKLIKSLVSSVQTRLGKVF